VAAPHHAIEASSGNTSVQGGTNWIEVGADQVELTCGASGLCFQHGAHGDRGVELPAG